MAFKKPDYDAIAKKMGFASKDAYSQSLGYASHAEHIGMITKTPPSFTRQGDAIALRDRRPQRSTVSSAVSNALGYKIK